MVVHEDISPDQQKVLELLVQGHSFTSAAQSTGVVSSIYRWMNYDPKFRKRFTTSGSNPSGNPAKAGW